MSTSLAYPPSADIQITKLSSALDLGRYSAGTAYAAIDDADRVTLWRQKPGETWFDGLARQGIWLTLAEVATLACLEPVQDLIHRGT